MQMEEQWHIWRELRNITASPVAWIVKDLPAMQETWLQSLSCEDALEKGVATHSSILTWETPQTEGPGRLQSTESQRVRHN